MKRLFLFLAILPIVLSSAFGQSMVEDALALERCIGNSGQFESNARSKPEYLAIIRQHVGKDAAMTDIELATSIRSTNGNPFLDDFVSEQTSEGIDTSTTRVQPISANFLSSIGGLNVTAIADGIAEFLVKRAKQELDMAFFERFRKVLAKTPQLATLLPSTWVVLGNIGEQIYNYEEYINALRSAFKKDLDNLLDNLTNLLEGYKGNPAAEKAITMFAEGAYVVRQLDNGVHPGAVLNSISGHQLPLQKMDSTGNLAAAVKTTNLFSQSLRSSDPSRYWVPMDSLLALGKDGFQIYLGLFYEKVKRSDTIAFVIDGKEVVLQTVLQNLAAKIATAKATVEAYRSFVTSLLQDGNAAESALQNLKGKKLDATNSGEYYQFMQSSIAVVEQVLELPTLPGLDSLDLDSIPQKLLRIMKQVNELFGDIETKQYGAAIFSATDLLVEALGDSFTYREALIKYGNFMANVVGATSSEAVAAAIEAVALPPGSSRIKKESPFSVAINGYVGADYLFVKSPDLSRLGGRVGVTAPVGLSLSMSLHPFKKKENGGSLSVFLSVIDVGALAGFRLNDDSTAIVGDIHLADIVSPGANLLFGIPRVPISIGAGYQASALLRKIGSDGKVDLSGKNPTWGWHAMLAVDIPFFNLYAKAQPIRTSKK